MGFSPFFFKNKKMTTTRPNLWCFCFCLCVLQEKQIRDRESCGNEKETNTVEIGEMWIIDYMCLSSLLPLKPFFIHHGSLFFPWRLLRSPCICQFGLEQHHSLRVDFSLWSAFFFFSFLSLFCTCFLFHVIKRRNWWENGRKTCAR